jgi:hypothetical protein
MGVVLLKVVCIKLMQVAFTGRATNPNPKVQFIHAGYQPGGESACRIEQCFAQGRRNRLSYRLDLDGSIELDKPGKHFTIDRIQVSDPGQDFGWLHPAAPLSFIVDDQVWKSAKVADWPYLLRKVPQSCTETAFYRQTIRRELLARFRPRPFHRHRLLAIRYLVRCEDVPAGLIAEIAAELRDFSAAPVCAK